MKLRTFLDRHAALLRDLGETAIASFIVLVAQLVVIKLLASSLSPADFGLISMERRYAGLIAALASAGTGVGLTKYIARRLAHGDCRRLLAVSVGVWVIAVVVGLVLLLALRPVDDVRSSEYLAVVLLGGGVSGANLTYAIHRGLMKFRIANSISVLQALGLIIASAGVFYGGFATRQHLILALGVSQALVLTFSVPVGVRSLRRLEEPDAIGERPALLGDFGIFSLGAMMPPFAMAWLMAAGPQSLVTAAPELAGYLVASQIFVRAIDGSLSFIGKVMLPWFSRSVEEEQRGQRGVVVMVHLGLLGGALAGALGMLFSGTLVRVLLGPEYKEAVSIVRLLMLGVAPYSTYVFCRSVNDAAYVRPVNAVLMMAAAILYTAILGLGRVGIFAPVGAAVHGLVAAMTLMGVGTLLLITRRYRVTRHVVASAAVALVVLTAAYAMGV